MLNETEINARLTTLPGWTHADRAIVKTFRFADYAQTMAFVNAIAWIAQRADHHPELTVGYDHVGVRYSTHSAGGLTEKDFDCAARIETLWRL